MTAEEPRPAAKARLNEGDGASGTKVTNAERPTPIAIPVPTTRAANTRPRRRNPLRLHSSAVPRASDGPLIWATLFDLWPGHLKTWARWPHCANAPSLLRAPGPNAGGDVRVDVGDLAGRRVARVFVPDEPADAVALEHPVVGAPSAAVASSRGTAKPGGAGGGRGAQRRRGARGRRPGATSTISNCDSMQSAIGWNNDGDPMSTMTTVQIDRRLKGRLDALKMHSRESYNDVLERILEDLGELDPEVRRRLDKISRDVQAGRFTTHAQLKRELGV